MSFEPKSPLATLAVPVLMADNALALKVLLPRAVAQAGRPSVPPLDQFRELMGWAYGLAGLSHAAGEVPSQSRYLKTSLQAFPCHSFVSVSR